LGGGFELDGSMKESSSDLSREGCWNFQSLWNNKLGLGVTGASNLVDLVYGWAELNFVSSLSQVFKADSNMLNFYCYWTLTVTIGYRCKVTF
jgi:hypothetical protein